MMESPYVATLLKSDYSTGVFLWILQNVQGHIICKTSGNGCIWMPLM